MQGVVLNAGGIVAYYPSKYPLHYRPPLLGDRDLYGELAKAAHDDGLAVFARMDSGRTHEAFYKAHPDWFARNAAGNPFRHRRSLRHLCQQSLLSGVHSRRLARKSSNARIPKGSPTTVGADLGRESICYCENCAKKFPRADRPRNIPIEKDWDDPVYREWIEWNYARRLRDLGLVQSYDQGRGRAALPVGRHEQRLGQRAVPQLPQSQGNLPPG